MMKDVGMPRIGVGKTKQNGGLLKNGVGKKWKKIIGLPENSSAQYLGAKKARIFSPLTTGRFSGLCPIGANIIKNDEPKRFYIPQWGRGTACGGGGALEGKALPQSLRDSSLTEGAKDPAGCTRKINVEIAVL
ncbi:MAG: hypothetical protein LBQ36_03280 [Synergistaceae bacterium]|jgi:hypothetical protein|nr:hypothetical protein [Synergistaceae bacterium]